MYLLIQRLQKGDVLQLMIGVSGARISQNEMDEINNNFEFGRSLRTN